MSRAFYVDDAGTSVAAWMTHMTRRLSALIVMFVIVGLALLLMWRVYLHHRATGDEDDVPGVIAAVSAPHTTISL
jgi:predicted alpha/beta hydrolase